MFDAVERHLSARPGGAEDLLEWQRTEIPPRTAFFVHQHPGIELVFLLKGSIWEIRLEEPAQIQRNCVEPMAPYDLKDPAYRFAKREFKAGVEGRWFANEMGSIHQTFTQDEECLMIALWPGRYVMFSEDQLPKNVFMPVNHSIDQEQRSMPGICYHLFSKQRLAMLDEHRPAEMLRSALEDVCLHAQLVLARRSSQEGLLGFLRRAPDPPEERSVRNGQQLLREIGAITEDQDHLPWPWESCLQTYFLENKCIDRSSECQDRKAIGLTALGVHLCSLPLSPQLAKTVIWAILLGVGDAAITIVSGLQYREPFVSLGNTGQSLSLAEANRAVRWAKQQLSPEGSDHLALGAASEAFEVARGRGGDAARRFCEAGSWNYDAMATQAAMFAGFAFEQITEPVPAATPFLLEMSYICLTALALGFNLCAFRPPKWPTGVRGGGSTLEDVEVYPEVCFRKELGQIRWVCQENDNPPRYECGSSAGPKETWIYFRRNVALVLCVPLSVFVLAIIYYVVTIVDQLVLPDDKAVFGHVTAWSRYENLNDLDAEAFRHAPGTSRPPRSARANCLSFRLMQNLRQTSAKLRSELRRRSLWFDGANRHGNDPSLVLAAVCAGLFPNLAFRPKRGKLKVNYGQLEAVPHPSSAIFDTDPEGAGPGGVNADGGGSWLCFNELSQEHYSLSGVSPARSSVLLLLCGEGPLREADLGDPEASPVSDAAISQWWSAQLGEAVEEIDRDEDVKVSLTELGTWVAFRMPLQTARRLQGLREMLRLVFRLFCSDEQRFHQLVAEGEVGATVLELAASLLKAEGGQDGRRTSGTSTRPRGRGRGAGLLTSTGGSTPGGTSSLRCLWLLRSDGHGQP
eukprot:g22225.t3